jgi:hypothetical protein
MASRRLFDGAQIEIGLLPIVGAGAPPPTEINLTPARLDNVNTFFTPTVSQAGGQQNVSPARLDNVNQFFTPTVSQASGPITLTPSRLDNVNTFYSPTVTGGAQPPQIIGGHYVDWWVKKYNAQFKRDEPEDLPTLEEVEEFVEEQPAQALEALRTVAPSAAIGITPALLAANERLIQSIADQLLIAIELRRIQLAEDDDIESILLML